MKVEVNFFSFHYLYPLPGVKPAVFCNIAEHFLLLNHQPVALDEKFRVIHRSLGSVIFAF